MHFGYNAVMPSATLDDISQLRLDLEELDNAIRAARSGQSYSIAGRTLTRQDLDVLDHERTRLLRRIKQTESVLQGARAPGTAVASWH